jgi:hypothetical protein
LEGEGCGVGEGRGANEVGADDEGWGWC